MSPDSKTCRLSVVIATHNAEQVIETCLTALASQIDPRVDELIVADSSADATPQIVRRTMPAIQLIHFDEPLPISQLRGRGIAASHGEIIAILDPYSIVRSGWVDELLKAHRERPNPVIGGTVDLYEENRQSLLVWAQYINEYGMFMSPVPEGEIEILPGSNISYKRHLLFDGQTPRHSDFWKTFINHDAEASGSALWLKPSIHVDLWKPIPFFDFLYSRRDHGRCFAGMRSARTSKFERFLRAATAPLLPFVFLHRWGKRYWARQRRRREFLLTLPLQFLLFGHWALGEFIGYCFGPSRSCQKLFY
ncbi:MAG: glycosyltransferase [Anaerolineales bacterium]|nr:glycosyltransferase [Anaerolineales bacterium]